MHSIVAVPRMLHAEKFSRLAGNSLTAGNRYLASAHRFAYAEVQVVPAHCEPPVLSTGLTVYRGADADTRVFDINAGE